VSVRVLDVNPGVKESDIVEFISMVEEEAAVSNKNIVVFFDEINTSLCNSIFL
jgi:hypothetical protein